MFFKVIQFKEVCNQKSCKTFKLDDLCYKPITSLGCIVASPMQYGQTDLDRLLADPDPKDTTIYIPSQELRKEFASL